MPAPRSIALTFDDGPDAQGTPAVLDALARADAHATFFVIAPRAERHPELLARMVSAGHTVGVHCDEHVRHTDRDRAWVHEDLRSALTRLAALGVTPSLWRTPWGVQAQWTPELARDAGLRLVHWTADTHDWRGDRAEEMLGATRDQLRDGAIVLAHDGIGPGARRDDVAETVKYVTLAARLAAEHGLRMEGLS